MRRPRVELEGAVYHVYNRVASGERLFDHPETAQIRRLIATLGAERWGQRCVDLARVLHKNPDVVSGWVSRGCRRHREDAGFAFTIGSLDAALAGGELDRWCKRVFLRS